MKSVSVVILTFNRPDEILYNVSSLVEGLGSDVEIIVVDNNSCNPVSNVLNEYANRIKVIELKENVGVGARNIGLRHASGEIVVTVDDDVYGINESGLRKIVNFFEMNASAGALNFKVVDDKTGVQMNWCHHRQVEQWGDSEFLTYEISEGAVAFRREAFFQAGGYPNYFFISHEGPDLAIGLMNYGWDVYYYPSVVVQHAHSDVARVSWRRYYYDTRNAIWLALRRYPAYMALKSVTVHLLAMFVYSLRDGYSRYWLKGIYDGFSGGRQAFRDRDPITKIAHARYRKIEKENPSFFYMLKKRLFSRKVSI